MKIELITNGCNFRSIADIVIDLNSYFDSTKREYKNNSIVFCKTDCIHILFDEVKDFNGNITLITHESDYPIDERMFLQRPNCIKKWFAQNANYKHPDLIPIPIGIENHFGPSKGSCIDLDFIEKELPIRCGKQNKIYVNFNNTHQSRSNVRAKLKNCENVFFSEGNLSSADYHREMAQYMFVASPRGNGIDCHRTWEALLVGSIPIVEQHFMYGFYPALPIIQIDSWDQVLEKGFLDRQAEKLLKRELDLSAVYMPYWRDKIYD